MPQRKVMIIGLDAATLELVRPWAREGHLPNLARFIDDGVCTILRTTIPVVSPAAWSTFATGVNPGKHGILNFAQLFPDSYQAKFVNASNRRGRTFWELAGEHGIAGGIINVPVTYPPRPFNGFMVAGMLSPGVNRRMVTPETILDELKTASPDYAVDVEVLNTGTADVRLTFLEKAVAGIHARLQAALALYRTHRPPLFCVVFVAADRVCHYFWRDMEAAGNGEPSTDVDRRLAGAILEVYRELDAAVGKLVEEAGPETDVVILSDHGAGPLRKGLNMRKVLVDAGLLAVSRPSAVSGAIKLGLLKFARVAPKSLQQKVKDLLPGLSRKAAGAITTGGIDFSCSRAYPAGGSEGVFVNLKGRQPQGIVAPGGEYETVRDEIIQVFSELTDPETGRRVMRTVHRREDVWNGPCTENLPDVVIEQEVRMYDVRPTSEVFATETFYELKQSGSGGLQVCGDHVREGLLMAMGPHVRPGVLDRAEIADVPATVLALLGVGIPEEYDGRVLAEILTDDVSVPERIANASDTEQSEETFNEDEAAALQDRLKGLGYM